MASQIDDVSQSMNQNVLSKFNSDLKFTVFKVTYLLLKQDDSSLYFVCLLYIIHWVQILYITFNINMYKIWQYESISQQISKITGYTIISVNLKNQTFSGFVVVFYVCIGSVLLAGMIFFLISMAPVKEKSVVSWPILILRVIIKLLTRVLFLPYMDMFFSMLSCEGEHLRLFPEVLCWTGDHIVHSIVAIFSIMVFGFLSFVFVLTYFEARVVPNHPLSKRNGRVSAYLVFYETMAVMAYQLVDIQYVYLTLAVFLIGSFFLLTQMHMENPYHDRKVSIIWSAISVVHFWSVILMLFSQILEGRFFKGTIITWMIGLPLLIWIVIREQPLEQDIIAMNMYKVHTGEQLINQCLFLTNLIGGTQQNRNSDLLVEGFLEIHRTACTKADCVLKRKKQLSSKIRDQRKKSHYSERDFLVLQIVDQMYSYGIKQFPQDVYLRLHYTFFLLDKMQMKQQALTELQQAEQNNPSLDYEFVIYRYKRIIEEDLQEQQMDQIDIVTELAFQTQSKLFQNSIERCSLNHMDFWSQLQEDTPDIGKLNSIGWRIQNSVRQVNEQWNVLNRMHSSSSKIIRLMGRFKLEVMFDTHEGERLLELARKSQTDYNKGGKGLKIVNFEDLSNESLPTVMLHTEIDKLGLICNVNMGICSLLGYTKTDLLNRKVNILMPDVYAKHHDIFLEQYLNQAENRLVNQTIWGVVKTKSNYVITVNLQVKLVQTLGQGLYFAGSFRQDLYFKQGCTIIVNPDFLIENISSSTQDMLGLDYRQCQLRQVNIHEYFPDFSDRSEECCQKGGSFLTYVTKSDERITLQCQIIKIQLARVLQVIHYDSDFFGYVLKLERPPNNQNDTSKLQIDKKNLSKYQFRYNQYSQSFVLDHAGAVTDHSKLDQSIPVDNSVVEESVAKPMNSDIQPQAPSHREGLVLERKEENFSSRPNYAEGIKIVRWFQGKLAEIDDQREEEEEEEMLERNQQSVMQDDDDQESDVNDNLFRNKTYLEQCISTERVPTTIRNLKIITNVIFCGVLALAFADYFVKQNYQSVLKDDVLFAQLSHQLTASVQFILTSVQDLKYMSRGLYKYYDRQFENQTRYDLASQIRIVSDIHTKLMLTDITVSEAYENYTKIFDRNSVKMYYYDQPYQFFDMNQALQQVLSKAVIIQQTQLDTYQDSDLFLIEYNILNDFYLALNDASYFYVGGLYTVIDSGLNNAQTIVILSGVTLIISLFMLIPLIYQVKQNQDRILSLFCEIPEKTIRMMMERVEAFITSLQIGDEDEGESELDIIQEEEDLESTFLSRKKRRRFKNSSLSHRNHLMGLFVISLIIQAYFLATYLDSQFTMQDLNQIVQELNVTSIFESYYRFADNAQKSLFFNKSSLILQQDAYKLNQMLNDYLRDLVTKLQIEHSQNVAIISDYGNAFTNIMLYNPCGLILTGQANLTCYLYANQSIAQGMSIGITRYLEDLAENMVDFDKKRASINTQHAREQRTIQTQYIRNSFLYLQKAMLTNIENNINSHNTQRLALFISFDVGLFILYFFMWLPLIVKLTRDIWRTRQLLLMIPLQVIQQIKSVKSYLRDILYH